MTTQKNKPVETIRDGAIKASIWRNDSAKGAFYSVTITRTYRDDQGKYHDSDSFSGTELLKLAHLAPKVYDRIAALRSADKPTDQAA